MILPGVEGVFGVKANHVPVISQLRPGIVELHSGAEVEKYFISGGWAYVHPNGVTDIQAVEAVTLDQVRVCVGAPCRSAAARPGAGRASLGRRAVGPLPSCLMLRTCSPDAQVDPAAVKSALAAAASAPAGDDFDAAVNRTAVELYSALDAALDSKA